MLEVKNLTVEELAVATAEFMSSTDIFPFNNFAYQRVFLSHFGAGGEVLHLGVFDAGVLLATIGLQRIGTEVFFIGMPPVLGNEEVTDYGDLRLFGVVGDVVVTDIWNSLLNWLFSNGVNKIQLDYVRSDSASYRFFASEATNQTNDVVQITPQAESPYIKLPTTWEEYVQSQKKKHRDELKRKLKRLEQVSPTYEWDLSATPEIVADFLRLHKLSDPLKQQFMSEQMAAFFTDLSVADYENGWQWRFAFCIYEGERVAAIAYFLKDQHSILLYNSGYDPQYAALGVGFGLKAHHLQHAIEQGIAVYDFLRGSERYKFDLGAVALQLYQITILKKSE